MSLLKLAAKPTRHYNKNYDASDPDTNIKFLEKTMKKISKNKPNYPQIPRTRNNTIAQDIQYAGMGGYATEIESGRIHATNPRKKLNRLVSPFHSIFDNSSAIKAVHRIGVKHEQSERKWMNIIREREGVNAASKLRGDKGGVKIGPFKVPTSNHASLAVMGEESNNVRGLSNKKIQDKFQRIRYGTGEQEVMKQITGKRYGIDHFTNADIEKLHHASQTTPFFKAKSKTMIGRVAGAGLAALAVGKNKKNEWGEDNTNAKRAGAGLAGFIAGGSAEKFVRTRLLKLHKR